jgi:predicted nucleic acid-binding protein
VTYTADAVALLVYLVDGLPERADELFARAEAGETVIHAPSTAVAETLYAVSRDTDVRGTELTARPAAVQRALLTNGPLSLVPPAEAELGAFSTVVDEFSIHDAMVVASHRARETEAVITNDSMIEAAAVETVW